MGTLRRLRCGGEAGRWKKEMVEEKLRLPENFREVQYLHTTASEKRHDLLMAPYGVTFPVFRTLVYLMQHPDGAAPLIKRTCALFPSSKQSPAGIWPAGLCALFGKGAPRG